MNWKTKRAIATVAAFLFGCFLGWCAGVNFDERGSALFVALLESTLFSFGVFCFTTET